VRGGRRLLGERVVVRRAWGKRKERKEKQPREGERGMEGQGNQNQGRNSTIQT